MKFLDLAYMACCDFYKKRERGIFRTSGLLMLTLVFSLNVLLFLFAFTRFLPEFLTLHSTYKFRYHIAGACLIVFVPFLYLRYFRITNYDEIRHKFDQMNDSKRSYYYIGATFYIILSIALTIGYVIYIGGIKSGWWG
jgi:hypothetical protein